MKLATMDERGGWSRGVGRGQTCGGMKFTIIVSGIDRYMCQAVQSA